jgi:hypothetical protein
VKAKNKQESELIKINEEKLKSNIQMKSNNANLIKELLALKELGETKTVAVNVIQDKLTSILNTNLNNKITEDIVNKYNNKLERIIYTLKPESQTKEALKTIDEVINFVGVAP